MVGQSFRLYQQTIQGELHNLCAPIGPIQVQPILLFTMTYELCAKEEICLR